MRWILKSITILSIVSGIVSGIIGAIINGILNGIFNILDAGVCHPREATKKCMAIQKTEQSYHK